MGLDQYNVSGSNAKSVECKEQCECCRRRLFRAGQGRARAAPRSWSSKRPRGSRARESVAFQVAKSRLCLSMDQTKGSEMDK